MHQANDRGLSDTSHIVCFHA